MHHQGRTGTVPGEYDSSSFVNALLGVWCYGWSMEPEPHTSSSRRLAEGRVALSRRSVAKEGFTLIELSIVLVIIGLIIGGILVGRDMIRAAELRSVLSDIEKFKTAFNTFNLKYNCIPGDCANATTFFGVDSNGCPYAGGSAGGVTGTCNGDGDGNVAPNSTGVYENYQAWRQLGFAGLIKGTYTGIPSGTQAKAGVNVPASSIFKVGYDVGYFNIGGNANPGYQLSGSSLCHRFVVAGERLNGVLNSSFATPYELIAMEAKVDDGNPVTGILTVIPDGYDYNLHYVGACSNWGASVASASNYYFKNSTYSCYMVFDAGF
jgi:prepilin-type N-terminal cleavage/methylation domain-containing protein